LILERWKKEKKKFIDRCAHTYFRLYFCFPSLLYKYRSSCFGFLFLFLVSGECVTYDKRQSTHFTITHTYVEGLFVFFLSCLYMFSFVCRNVFSFSLNLNLFNLFWFFIIHVVNDLIFLLCSFVFFHKVSVFFLLFCLLVFLFLFFGFLLFICSHHPTTCTTNEK